MTTTAVFDFDGALASTLESIQLCMRESLAIFSYRLLEHLMIKDYFDVILSAEDSAYRKPDARLYSNNIAPFLLSKTPGGVLVVGDTESDLLFAKQAGLKSCWATYGYGDAEKCLALKPDFVIWTLKT